MRNAALILLAAAVAACGGSSSGGSLETQSRNAVPTKSTVAMSSPKGGTKAAGSPYDTNGLNRDAYNADSKVGDVSTYAAMSYVLAVGINGGTAWTLGLIEAVVASPATSCTSDTCTWGPGSQASDTNQYKLTVTKVGDSHFTYALQAEPKSKPGSGFITFISGTAVSTAIPHVGSGEVIIDFDAAKKLDSPGNDTGKLTIDYSNVGNITLSATGLGLKDDQHPGQTVNVAYVFSQTPTQGDLDVAFRNTGSQNQVSLHSRWQQGGAGRGDAQLSLSNSTGSIKFHESECWGASFGVVYFKSDDTSKVTSGVETDCAFQTAAYGSITAP